MSNYQVVYNGSQWVQMGPRGSQWVSMPMGPNGFKQIPVGPNWSHAFTQKLIKDKNWAGIKRVPIDLNEFLWVPVGPNGSQWVPAVLNRSEWVIIDSMQYFIKKSLWKTKNEQKTSGSQWVSKCLNELPWVPMGPKRSQLVPMGPNRSQ